MITLNFNNPNSRTQTEIEIYRSLVDVPIADVPTIQPVATLDGFVTQYVDKDTVEGQDYNYRFRVFKPGGETIMSPNYVFGDVSLYGPGKYTEATSGTNKIWCLGLVDEPSPGTLLPNATDLASITGRDSEFLNWTGRWIKYRIGSDIYYTTYKGAIHIPTDEFEGFMSRLYSGRNINKSYCSYRVADSSISSSDVSAILDGCMPTMWSIEKEFPRQNALYPHAGSDQSARMVYSITDESNGRMLTAAKKHAICGSTYIYMPTHYNQTWYWKPLLKFVPKTIRNT